MHTPLKKWILKFHTQIDMASFFFTDFRATPTNGFGRILVKGETLEFRGKFLREAKT